MYDAILVGNSPAADAAWAHGFYGGGGGSGSGGSGSQFAHSSSSNLAGMATIRKRDNNNKRRSHLPNPKKVYEEAQMSRKVGACASACGGKDTKRGSVEFGR